jgi:hypothetical protein
LRYGVEFATPVPTWQIIPLPGVMRDPKGLVVHEGVPDTEIGQLEGDSAIELRTRIQEQNARCTVINAAGEQIGIRRMMATDRLNTELSPCFSQ